MSIFHLPDLGEGLPDAEIHHWYVKVGDEIGLDEPLVSMETAKAVVDVPSPQPGRILELYGQPGDIIKTGAPLVRFEASIQSNTEPDKGTVVGHLQTASATTTEAFTIGSGSSTNAIHIKATPSVRLLAKERGIDLRTVRGSGLMGLITKEDLENVITHSPHTTLNPELPAGFEPLKGVRRAMLLAMVEAHKQIVPVTIYDEVDISAWSPNTDITLRLIKAMIQACQSEPALNTWFDEQHLARRCMTSINIGLAVDSEAGLFVPVLQEAQLQSDEQLRANINLFKQQVHDRSVPAEALKGATITLSNFGKFAGRFATPVIVPPSVAILGVGKIYEAPVATEKKVAVHRIIPLSLTFDHRAVTGGEATRFLGVLIESLKRQN